MAKIMIGGQGLTVTAVVEVARAAPRQGQVDLDPLALARVARARDLVDRWVAEQKVIYGVTTGPGALKDRFVPQEQAAALQRNLVMSHATGVGEPLPEDAVRAAMLLRAHAMAQGHSGIRVSTLQLLLEMLNRGVHPVVPAKGSVGCSGDLAPLAHIALVLIGLGEATYQGRRLPGDAALRAAGLAPITLAPKEGLSLLNGTAVTTGTTTLALYDAEVLAASADVVAAMSVAALGGLLEPFDPRLQAVRPHPGQALVANDLRRLLEGSALVGGPQARRRVQDAYSLRCIPQVHGAVRDALAHVHRVVETELGSAIDNPMIFADDGEATALTGGNFHSQLVAFAADYLAIALQGLATISERRLARLVDEKANDGLLPPFLIADGGLNSGFMLAQYTAAALVSENKVLAHPASVDTIPTSAGLEDHVSMGAHAARKARQVVANVRDVLAIELFAATQALDLRRRPSAAPFGQGTAAAHALVRRHIPFLEQDAVMAPYIAVAADLIASGALLAAVAPVLGGPRERATTESEGG